MSTKLKKLWTVLLSVCLLLAFSSVGAFADEGGSSVLPDGVYTLTKGSSSLGMVGYKTGSITTVRVNGDNSEITFYSTKPKKYDAIWLGTMEEAKAAAANATGSQDGQISDDFPGLILGQYVEGEGGDDAWTDTEGVKGEPGKVYNAVKYVIPIATSTLMDVMTGKSSLNFVTRYAPADSKKGKFYYPSNQPRILLPEVQSLSVFNKEKMFKVVNAYLEKGTDATDFVFALSATGYEYTMAKTYPDAMVNGTDKAAWVKYAPADVRVKYKTWNSNTEQYDETDEATASKYQFRFSDVTVAGAGETAIPLIGISKNKVNDAETANPENPDYSQAFTARQAVVDADNGTVTVGNYEATLDAAVVCGENFGYGVDGKGSIAVKGGPANNECVYELSFQTKDNQFDAVFKGTAEEAAAGGAAAEPVNGKVVTVTYDGKEEGLKIIGGETMTISLRDKASKKWVERLLTADVLNQTITLGVSESVAAAEKAAAEKAAAEKLAKEKTAVKKTKVTGLKVKAGKKKLTVTWKSNKLFQGYQVSYQKKGAKKAKVIKVKGAKASKKVITKLAKKKKYTVKVRGYKNFNKKPVYGAWSAAKTVKVK